MIGSTTSEHRPGCGTWLGLSARSKVGLGRKHLAARHLLFAFRFASSGSPKDHEDAIGVGEAILFVPSIARLYIGLLLLLLLTAFLKVPLKPLFHEATIF